MPRSLGALIARRLGVIYRRTGQELQLTRGGSTFLLVGRVTGLAFPEQQTFFTSAQTAGWARPPYKIQIAGDYRPPSGGPSIGDTVALPDPLGNAGATLPYLIRYVDRSYFGGVIYRTTLYVSRNA